VSVGQILREAKQVVAREHTAVQLAVDAHGRKVRNPLHPTAVAWSTVGALVKVAPRRPEVVAEGKSPGSSDDANRAYDLLEEVAVSQGFANTVEVDQAGHGAVLRLFDRAMQLAPDEPRHKRAAGTGSTPRGTAPV
jgi:hypothetical protein